MHLDDIFGNLKISEIKSGLVASFVICVCITKEAIFMTAVEDLYYGNIITIKRIHKQGSTYSDVLGYIDRHQDEFLSVLIEQQKEIFEKLKSCESELCGMNERQDFPEGFKLATKLLIEVIQDTNE